MKIPFISAAYFLHEWNHGIMWVLSISVVPHFINTSIFIFNVSLTFHSSLYSFRKKICVESCAWYIYITSIKQDKNLLHWNLAFRLPICWNYSLKRVSNSRPAHFNLDRAGHWKSCPSDFQSDALRSLYVTLSIAPVNPSLFPLSLPTT